MCSAHLASRWRCANFRSRSLIDVWFFCHYLSPSQIVLPRNADWSQATVSSSSMGWTWGLSRHLRTAQFSLLAAAVVVICPGMLSWWRVYFEPPGLVFLQQVPSAATIKNHLFRRQKIRHKAPEGSLCFFIVFLLLLLSRDFNRKEKLLLAPCHHQEMMKMYSWMMLASRSIWYTMNELNLWEMNLFAMTVSTSLHGKCTS